MQMNKWGILGIAGLLLVSYNLSQGDLVAMRNNNATYPGTHTREAYGPSLDWLDRLAKSSREQGQTVDPKTGELTGSGNVKIDFSVMSSLMVAGLASGFKSQVANLLWMKSDEYWHQGLFTRQVPLMEAVVTLDPQFIEAWSTAGWHWAYNIYADIPSNADYKKKGDMAIRKAQENAVATGLDYLKRGANMNPDKYRLWFEWGWTRAEKAGIYDEQTLSLYRIARTKPDAILIEQTGRGGETKLVPGLDILGRTIGHLEERIPDFDKARDQYANDLMKATPAQRALLDAAGAYWRRYSDDYPAIINVYNSGDSTIKAQVRRLVPDIDKMIAAQNMRQMIAGQKGKDQPVGAYISITARYMPAWNMMKAGKYQDAINNIIGVMRADPKYNLQGLPVLEKIYELRGDNPTVIQAQLNAKRDFEKTSSQDLGLHFLAKIYEKAAIDAQRKNDKVNFQKYNLLAYRTWYRSRERDALDFYALRNTHLYEDKYGFKAPQDIIAEIKKSRQSGVPNAAPPVPPNVGAYYG